MYDASDNRQKAQQKIIRRAQRDPDFRDRLLKHPRQTIEQSLGVDIPSDVDFQVLEETRTTRYLVLPPPIDEERELSDDDLDAAAGGTGGDWGEWSGGSDWGSSGE